MDGKQYPRPEPQKPKRRPIVSELVAALRGIGQTQQGIADKLGVNHATVSRDLANANSAPATITNSRGQERPTSYQRTPTPANVNTTTGETEDDMPESEFAELEADDGEEVTRDSFTRYL